MKEKTHKKLSLKMIRVAQLNAHDTQFLFGGGPGPTNTSSPAGNTSMGTTTTWATAPGGPGPAPTSPTDPCLTFACPTITCPQ